MTTSATSAVTNVRILTAPMNTGRCMAFRERAVIHTVRGIIERYSLVSIGMYEYSSDVEARTVTCVAQEAEPAPAPLPRMNEGVGASAAPTPISLRDRGTTY